MFKVRRNKHKSSRQDDKHTSRNTVKRRGRARAQEKIAKRILGKDTGRRVFGFACSPAIHARLKMLAGELQVPLFAVMEHALQLSSGLMAKAKENSEERDILRRHLIEAHVDKRTIEKFTWYDEELARELNEERLYRFEIDRVVHQLVVDFVRKGMNAKYMAYYLDYGYSCFVAYINGRPMPEPQRGRFRSQPRPPDNQSTDEKGDEIDNESSEHSG